MEVFAGSDRSQGLRTIGTDERWANAELGGSVPWWPGAVRTDEHQYLGDGTAVDRHEQLRSYLASETR